MNDPTVSNKIKKLPPAAKKQAQDYVDFLYEKYVKADANESAKKSIIEDSFFGMWKDREDMQDSTAWVREIRKSQWPNS
jgi:hypothetical protein